MVRIAPRRAAMVCSSCRLHPTLCICALVPQLQTRTRVLLVVPAGEARKPSNTGQLAVRCLPGSTIQIVRKRSGPVQAPIVHPGELPLVLFPAADAVPLTEYADAPRPIALIVPDGSWHQARALQQRRPLAEHACVTLPSLGASEYRLRSEPQRDGLATFEAIARALRILEGSAGEMICDAMLGVFRVMVERTLWFRGKLRDHEVRGGVPAAALADDPRGAATRAALRTRDHNSW
jgi:DTW domain-containing protein YfiP